MLRAGDCRHYLSVVSPCAAGVDPSTVRDDSGPGTYRWPCAATLRRSLGRRDGPECRTSCAKFAPLTEQEANDLAAEIERACAAALGGLCPTCGAGLERHESGRSVAWTCDEHGLVRRDCDVQEVP